MPRWTRDAPKASFRFSPKKPLAFLFDDLFRFF